MIDTSKPTVVAKAKNPIASKTIIAGVVVAASGIAEIAGYVQEKGIPADKMGWVHLAMGAAVIAFRWIARQPVSLRSETKQVEAP